MAKSDTFRRHISTPRKWDVWFADVSFENISGHKGRPVVVLGCTGNNVRVLEITSHAVRGFMDLEIIDRSSAGLERASTVKCASPKIVDSRRFTAKLGTLGNIDKGNLSRRGF